MYKGVTTVGFDNFTALYSNSESFSEGFNRGIQHLFYNDYTYDLIKKCITLIRNEENLLYSNITYDLHHAPKEIEIIEEGWEDLYKVYSKYKEYKGIERKSFCYALDNCIVIEESIRNNNSINVCIDVFAYIVFNNTKKGLLEYNKDYDCLIWDSGVKEKYVIIGLDRKSDFHVLSVEHINFDFAGFQKILQKEYNQKDHLKSEFGISAAIGSQCNIPSDEQILFRWFIVPCKKIEEGLKFLQRIRNINLQEYGNVIYTSFIDQTSKVIDYNKYANNKWKKIYYRNLLAIKSVNLNGFIPADITGHYFTHLGPCFYPRDALMVAKAFLYSELFEEAKKIFNFLSNLEFKEKGEFYQRYDCYCKPSEGANNYVEHQLDSIGYYLSLIKYYFDLTGELLINKDKLEEIIHCCESYKGYNKLIGPEGGVNEGVYGQAYITSTNMFILGGLMNARKLLKVINPTDVNLKSKIDSLIEDISEGIETMWDKNYKYYYYGFSLTTNCVVKRYDTPQYFSPLYGYYNEKMLHNNSYLLKNASFHGDGIGYSQQSYHHGAWIFNTAACAQFNYFVDNITEYVKKVEWLVNHTNNFGLMPEAVDAKYEHVCYINPLTWACAEMVSALAYPYYKEVYAKQLSGDKI